LRQPGWKRGKKKEGTKGDAKEEAEGNQPVEGGCGGGEEAEEGGEGDCPNEALAPAKPVPNPAPEDAPNELPQEGHRREQALLEVCELWPLWGREKR